MARRLRNFATAAPWRPGATRDVGRPAAGLHDRGVALGSLGGGEERIWLKGRRRVGRQRGLQRRRGRRRLLFRFRRDLDGDRGAGRGGGAVGAARRRRAAFAAGGAAIAGGAATAGDARGGRGDGARDDRLGGGGTGVAAGAARARRGSGLRQAQPKLGRIRTGRRLKSHEMSYLRRLDLPKALHPNANHTRVASANANHKMVTKSPRRLSCGAFASPRSRYAAAAAHARRAAASARCRPSATGR